MLRMRVVLFFLLMLGGVFFLLKGGSSVYSWVRPFEPPSLHSPEVPNEAVGETLGQPLEEGAYLARLSIPRLDAAWNLVEGVSDAALRMGPGHMAGTPLPGSVGNAVIAGHRDTHFRVLKEIAVGDEIVIEGGSGRVVYTVVETQVVDSTDLSVLSPTFRPTLTLITCYPFGFVGPAPRRFIVRALGDLAPRLQPDFVSG